MALRLIQFLAIMLTALALISLRCRIRWQWRRQPNQQIYAGWALFGIVLFGALAANLAHTIVLCRLGRSFGYALASFLLISANLAIFFVWTFPTNQATNNWTVVPN